MWTLEFIAICLFFIQDQGYGSVNRKLKPDRKSLTDESDEINEMFILKLQSQVKTLVDEK